jgi:hypothetical protein
MSKGGIHLILLLYTMQSGTHKKPWWPGYWNLVEPRYRWRWMGMDGTDGWIL